MSKGSGGALGFSSNLAEARAGLAGSMRVRLLGVALVQAAIWASHALFYEDLIFPSREYALPYRAAQLAQCLGLLWLASGKRNARTLDWGAALLFAAILPIHGLAMQVVHEASFVPFLLTMEWGQGLIALAALLSYRPALFLFGTAWLVGVATVTLRPGFDPDLSDHVVLLLIYAVVAASIRAQDRLRVSELVARRALEEARRHRALDEQREEFLGELHDGVSAALSRAALLLDSTERVPSESRRRQILEKARVAVLDALAEARALLTLREQPTVDASWTAFCVERALREAAQGFDVEVSLSTHVEGANIPLSAAVHHALCRLASEATTNALKHSAAPALLGELEVTPEQVRFLLRNSLPEGTSEPRSSEARRGAGFGMHAARRRLSRLGGALSAGPTGDGYWVLKAHLPLHGGPHGALTEAA